MVRQEPADALHLDALLPAGAPFAGRRPARCAGPLPRRSCRSRCPLREARKVLLDPTWAMIEQDQRRPDDEQVQWIEKHGVYLHHGGQDLARNRPRLRVSYAAASAVPGRGGDLRTRLAASSTAAGAGARLNLAPGLGQLVGLLVALDVLDQAAAPPPEPRPRRATPGGIAAHGPIRRAPALTGTGEPAGAGIKSEGLLAGRKSSAQEPPAPMDSQPDARSVCA